MVRREGIAKRAARAASEAEPCCTVPTGESPVRVIAGEPGSRPAPEAERPKGEAWCQKPLAAEAVSGEQARGPQHEVKPAASSLSQSESRAEHVAVKAMFPARESGWGGSLGGVWGAAREHGAARNTRGPSERRRSKPQGCPYKLMAKSGAAQRESEGVVVPLMVVLHNATGGKGPCFNHAAEERRREGMTGKSASNHPFGQIPGAKAPDSRPQLRGTAKLKPTYAVRRGLSASRMREIRTYGLNGGPARDRGIHLNETPAGGRIYQ
jgi:hypothetical protein